VEDCSGSEGRAEAEVDLPLHLTVFGGVRGRFHGAGSPARAPTSAKPAVCGRDRPYGVALRPDSGERTCGWDRARWNDDSGRLARPAERRRARAGRPHRPVGAAS
jgi:hypothetical protein